MTELAVFPGPSQGDRPPTRRRGGLAEDVVVHIREQILTGALKPGTKIDQEALAATLDVSRSPIREALVILGQEGLLEVIPRRGAVVADLTPEDIIDHYELFGVVAGRAAAIAADTLKDDEIEQLRAIHERFVVGTSDDLSALNWAFHRIINRAAPRRTRWLLRLLERSVPADYYEFTNGWDAQAVGHHAAILEAIVERNADEARRRMEHHLHESGMGAVAYLQRQGFWED